MGIGKRPSSQKSRSTHAVESTTSNSSIGKVLFSKKHAKMKLARSDLSCCHAAHRTVAIGRFDIYG